MAVKKNGVGDNAKNAAPIKWSGKAEAAIAFEATSQIESGKLMMRVISHHVAAYMNDRTYLDNAKAIMEAVRERVVAHWEKHPGHFADAKRSVPPVRETRVSEFRKLVRIGEWKCAPVILDYFKDDKMTWDDALTVANYLIRETPRNSKAPSKDALITAIRERKAAKTGRFNEKGELEKVAPTVRPLDISDANDTLAGIAARWNAFIGSDKVNAKQRSALREAVKRITAAAGELAAAAASAKLA